MCEQMGVTPDPERMMLSFSDLPLIVQKAFRVYSKLPELYVSRGMEGSLFIGKDYSSFLAICKLFGILDERDRSTVLYVCEYTEQKYIAKARAQLNK